MIFAPSGISRRTASSSIGFRILRISGPSMTDAAIVNHIAKLPHARASFKQLVRELGRKGASREELEEALERLEERGELIQPRGGHYVLTRMNHEYAVGRMVAHRDGYGFVVLDPPVEGINGDLFLPPGE